MKLSALETFKKSEETLKSEIATAQDVFKFPAVEREYISKAESKAKFVIMLGLM